MTFGMNLKAARKRAGMTQSELAARVGCSYQMVQRYETGERNPKLETVARFAEALGVDPEELYGDEHASLLRFRESLNKHDGAGAEKALGLAPGSIRFVARVESVQEAELLLAFRGLSDDQRGLVLNLVRSMA